MDEKTKVTLSAGELNIAGNRDFILTKRVIMDSAANLFSSLVPGLTKDFDNDLFDERIKKSAPKISRGENYNGFPYVIMDYPSVFTKENVFALRSMFLWGNFFSITLHLSGDFKNKYETNLLRKDSALTEDLFVCINDTQWEHHFGEDNYASALSLSEAQKEKIKAAPFLKVALKYELHHWNMMQSILPKGYNQIFDLL